MVISSSKTEFADHTVFTHLILDPERRGRELRRYMLKHMDDYDPFAVKRKGFMVLMSSQPIERDQLIPLYYTRQFVEKAYSYSKDDLSLLPLRVHGEDALRGYLFRFRNVSKAISTDPISFCTSMYTIRERNIMNRYPLRASSP